MKFIAKCDYTLGIKKAVMRPEVSQNGVTTYVPVEPAVKAVFTSKTLSHAEIESARAQFLNNGGPYAFGSIPGRDEGNINVQDAVQEGYTSTAHQGYDVYQNLKTFDTADAQQCPPESRSEVEQFMLAHYDLGNFFVRVDDFALAPPWPTYPVEGDVNVDALVAFAKAGGMVDATLVFEEAVGQREDVIAAFREASMELAAQREEEAGLTARV